jgi:hypothetical protein
LTEVTELVRPRRARSVAAVLGAALVLWAPTPALASGGLPPGVHVDPGSPAGKQYQIPIPSARNETAGATGGGNSNAPLFGVGITPSAAGGAPPATAGAASSEGGGASGGSGTGSSGSRGGPSGSSAGSSGSGTAPSASASGSSSTSGAPASSHPTGSAGTPSPAASPPAAPLAGSASARADGVGGSSWLPLVAGGALVLVLGGGGGLALRLRVSRV